MSRSQKGNESIGIVKFLYPVSKTSDREVNEKRLHKSTNSIYRNSSDGVLTTAPKNNIGIYLVDETDIVGHDTVKGYVCGWSGMDPRLQGVVRWGEVGCEPIRKRSW